MYNPCRKYISLIGNVCVACRWHMRRIREQRHVERLRQRQRDPWGPNSTRRYSRGEYTVWPQPIRDLQYIEITDTLPVTAFGEDLPELPEKLVFIFYRTLAWNQQSIYIPLMSRALS